MTKSGFDLIAQGIEDNLDHLHKERWGQIAAGMHAAVEHAQGDAKEKANQALREHYADRFKPETSRGPLMEQAAANHAARQAEAAATGSPPPPAPSTFRSR